jgi:hypothetical protein
MLYLANPSTAAIRAEITGCRLGAIMTPRQGNELPALGWYAADNGCGPGKNGVGAGFPGNDAYLAWLMELEEAESLGNHDPGTAHYDAEGWCANVDDWRYDPDQWRCLFAVAPDVVGDAAATIARSQYFLPLIWEYTRFPAAFVAQNGQERLPVPWDDFGVLFLGGSAECVPCRYVRPVTDFEWEQCPGCGRRLTEWKLGAAARELAAEAKARGKRVHMGRVNSRKRFRYAMSIGCDSVDGTHLIKAPDKNLANVLSWAREADDQLPLWDVA